MGVSVRTGLAIGGAMAVALGGAGCGPKPTVGLPAETARLEQAVSNLRSGAVIRSMNDDLQTHVSHDLSSAVAVPGDGIKSRPPKAPGKDPCPEVEPLAQSASEEAWASGLKKFGACLRRAMEPVDVARGALIDEITFGRSLTEKPLSRMSDSELTQLLRDDFRTPGALAGLSDQEAPQRSKLRNRFEDRELDELARLAKKLTARLSAAEAVFFAAVEAHRPLVEHFARTSNRYELLLALGDYAAQGQSAMALASKIVDIVGARGMSVPSDLQSFPVAMLRPWSIVAVSPDEGHEGDPLHEPLENPFQIALRALAQMGGPDSLVAAQRARYVALRSSENPPMPSHPAPDAQAVRIALADTGVDFLRYPELGEFLSNGQSGTMGSFDFEDNDADPYLPADGLDAHGSGAAATVLTVLSHFAPDALLARKVDLAMWKLGTIRDQLAAPYLGLVSWQSREAMPEALIREATDPQFVLKPKIVSISALFSLQPYLEHSHHADAVLKAPWLWVMAAGNEGVPLNQDQVPACLGDVPPQNRVDARILCVGALTHGILQDKIAGYSNYGDRVDLYAYESYIDLCPNGTSCSTPAVSGAAAAVAAQYPELSPEEIKAVLVEAAESRTLEVDTSTTPVTAGSGGGAVVGGSSGPTHARTVKVLDPARMMPQVMAVAARHAAAIGATAKAAAAVQR